MPQKITQREIRGMFYESLESIGSASWVDPLSRLMPSDQDEEDYAWLGNSPQMREWIGGRQAKSLREFFYSIRNKKFESTLRVPLELLERDKTGQLPIRISELSQVAVEHWAELLSALIETGESTTCYDGQYFFDTDHAEGDSGSQSNDITYDAATTTAPSADEAQKAILASVQQLIGLKNDQGKPINQNARNFLVMAPVPFLMPFAQALGATVIGQTSNLVQAVSSIAGFQITLAINPYLTWTTKFATFATGGMITPFIRQEEQAIQLSILGEGSDHEFHHDEHLYGAKARRNVGYGRWQKACLTTFN
jgi:phage major head subunit gpT-like protein